MTEVTKIAELLHEAAETHHVVYRIVDGDDRTHAGSRSASEPERWAASISAVC